MKKALLATLIGAAFMGSAAAADYDFTYGEGDPNFYGYQKKETIDVAIFLPGSTFEGMKVKSVSVPVYATKGISGYSNPQVWLSSELVLEKKKNAPNIASYDATLEMASEDVATLSFTLPESYTVTADGVYVGYSVTVDKLDGSTRYPIALTSGGASGSLFVHTTKVVTNWTDQAVSDHRSSAMTVVVEADNLAAQNVSVASMPSVVNLSLNEPASVDVKLSSTASESVTSVDFEYTFAGKAESYHYDLPEAVPAGIGKLFAAKFVVPAQSALGSEKVEVTVTKVNGQPNSSKSASSAVTVSVFEIAPVHQALMEEYTGTWCGWCTRGWAAMEYIKENYPDFVTAAYHNGDPMQVTTSYPASIDGFPSASFDRAVVGDPYSGTGTYGGLVPAVEDILAINEEVTPWALKLGHTWLYDNILTANLDILNTEGFENGSYKIGYLLVCDGLSGEGSSWEQSNNYASSAPQYFTQLNWFCKGGQYGQSKVVGLVFNDVVVSIDGYKGVNGSVPSAMAAGEKISVSKSWDLNKIKPELIPDKNKLRIVAFVLDSKGKSLNATKDHITDFVATGNEGELPTAVEDLDADDNAPVEYYNLNGMKVSNPQGGIFIRRQGNTTEKVILK